MKTILTLTLIALVFTTSCDDEPSPGGNGNNDSEPPAASLCDGSDVSDFAYEGVTVDPGFACPIGDQGYFCDTAEDCNDGMICYALTDADNPVKKCLFQCESGPDCGQVLGAQSCVSMGHVEPGFACCSSVNGSCSGIGHRCEGQPATHPDFPTSTHCIDPLTPSNLGHLQDEVCVRACRSNDDCSGQPCVFLGEDAPGVCWPESIALTAEVEADEGCQ